ncbi:hypothetical protein LCGC14_0789680, partial [marine sediment metagenome]
MLKELKELREKQLANEAKLAKVFEEAKTDDGQPEFTQVTCLGDEVKGDSYAVAEKVRGMNDELTENGKKIDDLATAEKVADDLAERTKGVRQVPHPSEGARRKSLGEMVTEHKLYEDWVAGNKSAAEMKDLFKGTVMCGIDRTIFGQATPAQAAAHVREGVAMGGDTRFLLANGCSIMPEYSHR